jgi:acetyl/propionyl-CoA carboxylase alpha subunit
VTELVTGIDLVVLQFKIAAGERLPFAQADVRARGAAIELRITAEDPFADFVPSSGRVALARLPSGPGVRVDHALYDGIVIPTEYDALLAKIVAHGATRVEALERASRAVRETIIAGIPTSLAFHARTLGEADFAAGRYDTGYIGAHWPPSDEPDLERSALIAGALGAVLAKRASARHASTGGSAPADAGAGGAWGRAAREDQLR